MTIADVGAGAAGQTWRHVVVAAFEKIIAAHTERRRRRRQIAELMSLGPRALKDIGMDPSEISSIVHGAGRDTSRIRR
jgi:uncharacterized protein YjiS (DUF1127 family)